MSLTHSAATAGKRIAFPDWFTARAREPKIRMGVVRKWGGLTLLLNRANRKTDGVHLARCYPIECWVFVDSINSYACCGFTWHTFPYTTATKSRRMFDTDCVLCMDFPEPLARIVSSMRHRRICAPTLSNIGWLIVHHTHTHWLRLPAVFVGVTEAHTHTSRASIRKCTAKRGWHDFCVRIFVRFFGQTAHHQRTIAYACDFILAHAPRRLGQHLENTKNCVRRTATTATIMHVWRRHVGANARSTLVGWLALCGLVVHLFTQNVKYECCSYTRLTDSEKHNQLHTNCTVLFWVPFRMQVAIGKSTISQATKLVVGLLKNHDKNEINIIGTHAGNVCV